MTAKLGDMLEGAGARGDGVFAARGRCRGCPRIDAGDAGAGALARRGGPRRRLTCFSTLRKRWGRRAAGGPHLFRGRGRWGNIVLQGVSGASEIR